MVGLDIVANTHVEQCINVLLNKSVYLFKVVLHGNEIIYLFCHLVSFHSWNYCFHIRYGINAKRRMDEKVVIPRGRSRIRREVKWWVTKN